MNQSCDSRNESLGTVTRVIGDDLWVEVHHVGCGQCATQGGCGSGLLGMRARQREYRLRNTIGARVGDSIVLGSAEGRVLKGALRAYALPLALGLSGVSVTTWLGLGHGDGVAALALLCGIFSGWLLLRAFPVGNDPSFTIKLQSPLLQSTHRLTEESR